MFDKWWRKTIQLMGRLKNLQIPFFRHPVRSKDQIAQCTKKYRVFIKSACTLVQSRFGGFLSGCEKMSENYCEFLVNSNFPPISNFPELKILVESASRLYEHPVSLPFTTTVSCHHLWRRSIRLAIRKARSHQEMPGDRCCCESQYCKGGLGNTG